MTPGVACPQLLDDPYPIYEALRSSMPVCWDQERRVWLLSRYADVLRALEDRRLSSSAPPDSAPRAAGDPAPSSEARALLALQLEMSDPPDHARRRALVQKALAERGRTDVLDAISQTVHDLLATPFRTGRMDVIEDLAAPLTSRVLLRLLGFSGGEAVVFARCVNTMVECFDHLRPMQPSERAARAEAAHCAVVELDDIIARHARPEGPSLIRNLCDAEIDGVRLTPREVIANAILLFAAGDGTTTNLIGSGVLALVRHPAEARRVARTPHLIETAVEEILRYESPIQSISRIATVDMQLHGQIIRCGDTVVLLLGSANRDEREFVRAAEFDVARAPNRHLAFGRGPHVCPGAWLARAQAKAAIGTLLARVGEPHLAVTQVEWHRVSSFRGPKCVPIVFDPAPVVGAV